MAKGNNIEGVGGQFDTIKISRGILVKGVGQLGTEVISTSTQSGIIYVTEGREHIASCILRCLGLIHTPSTPNKLEPPPRS